MAERLPLIKLQPARVLDASPALGASAEPLRLAYPKAEMLWHESDPALAERAAAARSASWWQKLRGAGGGRVDVLPARPEVELLWSNMALHAAADLPRLLGDWQASLAVGGFVMFSCLGPDSFVELRPLYARAGWGRPAPDWWDMHDIGDLVLKAGFADPVMDQERLRLTWADPDSLLADLKCRPDFHLVLRQAGGLVPAQLTATLASVREQVYRDWRITILAEAADADVTSAISPTTRTWPAAIRRKACG